MDPIDTVLERLSSPVLPSAPSPADQRLRRERLGEELARHGAEALFTEPGGTSRYLAGLPGNVSERLFGLVVQRDGSAWVVAPSFERGTLEGLLGDRLGAELELLTWEEHEHGYSMLAAQLRARGVHRLALDSGVRRLVSEGLASAWDGQQVSGARAVEEVRSIKDSQEIELLRMANLLTKKAIAVVAELVEPGWTGAEVARLVHRCQQSLGLEDTWDLTLVDAAAAEPHGRTTDTEIRPGSVLLVDTGGTLHGYHSDCTRTWAVGGNGSDRFRRAWDAVRAAQDAALGAFRAGAPCRAVDAAARKVIAASGFGQGYAAFSHRLGHGIGLEIHEPPHCDGGSEREMRPGMCFSNEPGIYVPGEMGVRIEDVVLIGEDGPEVFGDRQTDSRRPF